MNKVTSSLINLFLWTHTRPIVFALLCCANILPQTNAQELIHRYSFDADASDLSGDADGILGGNATIINRAVVLDGVDAFVDLPNDLVSELTNATFEVWASWNGGPNYQALISFGSNPNGEGLQGSATKNIYLTPNNGSGLTLTIFTNGSPQRTVLAPALRAGVTHQIVWTHDAVSSISRLYVDGKLAATNTIPYTLKDLGITDNNWLGRSQYAWDPDFAGSIAEFRIYNGVLSEEAIKASYERGPDPSGKGAVLSLEVQAPSVLRPGGSRQLLVLGNFETVSGLDVTADPGITYEVSDSSILTVSPAGIVTAVGASGSAQVTARLGGQSSSQTIQTVPLEPAELLHRYSFDADANDSVGSAHGELLANAVIQNGAVVLDGATAYVNLPNDLVKNLTNATFEVWTTWEGGGAWQRIWDFGNSSNGEDSRGSGTQSIVLTPDNGAGLRVSIFTDGIGNEQIVTDSPLSKGSLHHIVWAYDSVARTARLYVDGVLADANTNMTHTLPGLGSTVNNWLGQSQYTWDANYKGSIAEFRIYDGVLAASNIASNYLSGPDPTGRGALQSIAVEIRPVMRVQDSQPFRVLANFERAERIDVTRDSALVVTVSDANLLSVSVPGKLDSPGIAPGTGTVTFSYASGSTNLNVQLLPAAESKLIHRYSFQENADDLVGDAHGVLKENASIAHGELVLDGANAYVDLPNNLVRSLTNATFEVWTRWNGGANWQRMIDFGNSTAGEDQRGSAVQSIFLTPNNGASLEVSIFPDGIANEQTVNGAILSTGVVHHIVWTYDALSLKGRLFVDGSLAGETAGITHTLAGLGDTSNNWLGRSQYTWDADYNGTIQELRIYDGPLSSQQVSANYQAGTEELSSETPRLSVTRVGSAVDLTWATPDTAFTLESTERLEPADWQVETSEIITDRNLKRVRIQIGGGQRFYRLKRQTTP